jgi:hypothetical protein
MQSKWKVEYKGLGLVRKKERTVVQARASMVQVELCLVEGGG